MKKYFVHAFYECLTEWKLKTLTKECLGRQLTLKHYRKKKEQAGFQICFHSVSDSRW